MVYFRCSLKVIDIEQSIGQSSLGLTHIVYLGLTFYSTFRPHFSYHVVRWCFRPVHSSLHLSTARLNYVLPNGLCNVYIEVRWMSPYMVRNRSISLNKSLGSDQRI